MRPRLQALMGEFEQALREAQPDESRLRGHLRVKSPTTVGNVMGEALTRFAAANPQVTIELLLIDRAVNPLEESFDVAVGALPMSFASVIDVPLCPYHRLLVAAPGYLDRSPAAAAPERAHPARLPRLPAAWASPGRSRPRSGAVAAEVRARFAANDSRVLLSAALTGLGIAVMPQFLAREALGRGPPGARAARLSADADLVQGDGAAQQGPPPRGRGPRRPLKGEFGPVPPWDR